MNVLEEAVAHLSGALGVPVSTAVPAERPQAFVTVERGGGRVTPYSDSPSLTVQVWHSDRLALESLADAACDALMGLVDAVDGAMSAEITKSYYPEQVTGYWPRYVIACDLYCSR